MTIFTTQLGTSYVSDAEPEITLASGQRVLAAIHQIVCELLHSGHAITLTADSVRVEPAVYHGLVELLEMNVADVEAVVAAERPSVVH